MPGRLPPRSQGRGTPAAPIGSREEAAWHSFVLIEGIVETSPNPPDMLDWTTRIARRYMGADLAEVYGKRNAVAGELLVRVTPTRIIARTGIAD
jgi:hypothetical protein